MYRRLEFSGFQNGGEHDPISKLAEEVNRANGRIILLVHPFGDVAKTLLCSTRQSLSGDDQGLRKARTYYRRIIHSLSDIDCPIIVLAEPPYESGGSMHESADTYLTKTYFPRFYYVPTEWRDPTPAQAIRNGRANSDGNDRENRLVDLISKLAEMGAREIYIGGMYLRLPSSTTRAYGCVNMVLDAIGTYNLGMDDPMRVEAVLINECLLTF